MARSVTLARPPLVPPVSPSDGANLGVRPPWRPRKFSTPGGLLSAAYAYLRQCDAREQPVTLHGVALALGFAEPASLHAYADYGPDFARAVKVIRSLVSQAYEERLHSRDCVGAIFALKNVAGWTDSRDINFKGILGTVPLEKMGEEQLRRTIAGEHPVSVLAESLPREELKALSAGGTPSVAPQSAHGPAQTPAVRDVAAPGAQAGTNGKGKAPKTPKAKRPK